MAGDTSLGVVYAAIAARLQAVIIIVDKAYKHAFAELNKEQRRAVKNIEGPMLVVAGPGTGKTQLLSTRVAYILKNTDSKANNVLCLTYTNKAAVNMKDRIIRLAGREGARVPASTFHSFAGEIMGLYPDYFWNSAKLSIAPDAVQLDIVESIAGQLPLDNPLAQKFAGQFTLLKDIKDSINLAKEAGLTPEKLRQLIQFNLKYINHIEAKLIKIFGSKLSLKKLPALAAEVESLAPQDVKIDYFPLVSLSQVLNASLAAAIESDLSLGKCTQTSKWKSRWLQTTGGRVSMLNERKRNEWWLNLADFYQSYLQELHRRGFYDYADMLVETIAQLENNDALLAEVQERFSYVMVDEFQDSTPAQLRFAHLIADHHSAEGKPNFMVVGDDDQTIFRFNGAEVNNLLNFEQHYPDAVKIVLKDNYRSSQAILDFSRSIIEQADTRIAKIDRLLDKKLVAVRPPKKTTIRTLAFSTSELQLSQVSRDIKKCYRRHTSSAVLARNHASLIKMAGILQQLKVPIRYEQAADILENEIVTQVYLISKLLLSIQKGDIGESNSLVHKVIRWPAWQLPPKKLWRLATSRSGNWLDSLIRSPDRSLNAIGDWLAWLAQQADCQPLSITIEQILGLRPSRDFTSPLRGYFIKNTAAQINRYFYGLSAIQLLRNLTHEFGASSQPSLEDLVRFVELNRQNGVVLSDESPFITGDRSVQLLTVHKAKGLEFDNVYIIDAVDENWRPRAGGRRPPANLPLQSHGEESDDYIRLMYVAATRAKSNLTISAYLQDHSGRELSLSPIIDSVNPFERISTLRQPDILTTLEENLRWPDLSQGEEKAMLKARLESFNLNVTQLLHFLDVQNHGPQFFKERHLLLLPEVKTPSQAFGTAIHSALRLAQHQTNKGRHALDKIVAEFEQTLTAENLIPAEFGRQLKKGKQLLVRLFDEFKYTLPKDALAEYRLQDVRLGTARLSGALDRLDVTNDSVMIADYKTGRPLGSLDTKAKSLVLKAHKHRLQLIFYSLLFGAEKGPSQPAVSAEMVYLEADNPKGLSKQYTPTETDKMYLSSLIQAVWQKIQSVDMPDTTKYTPDFQGVLRFEQDLIDGK